MYHLVARSVFNHFLSLSISLSLSARSRWFRWMNCDVGLSKPSMLLKYICIVILYRRFTWLHAWLWMFSAKILVKLREKKNEQYIITAPSVTDRLKTNQIMNFGNHDHKLLICFVIPWMKIRFTASRLIHFNCIAPFYHSIFLRNSLPVSTQFFCFFSFLVFFWFILIFIFMRNKKKDFIFNNDWIVFIVFCAVFF